MSAHPRRENDPLTCELPLDIAHAWTPFAAPTPWPMCLESSLDVGGASVTVYHKERHKRRVWFTWIQLLHLHVELLGAHRVELHKAEDRTGVTA